MAHQNDFEPSDNNKSNQQRQQGTKEEKGPRPNYYKATLKRGVNSIDVECFELIDALEFDFYLGNLLKYIWRAGRKDSTWKGTMDDLLKARVYLDQEIQKLSYNNPNAK